MRALRVQLGPVLATALVALFAGAGPAATAATVDRATAAYRVEGLGTLSGDGSSVAAGLNAGGDVVGWSSGPTGTRAFVYTDEAGMQLLGAPAGRPHTVARAINDAGVVVGSATTGGTDLGHAVRWTGGVPHDLGTLDAGPYSEGYAVNAAGTAVGYSYVDGAHLDGTHAFTQTDPGAMTDLTPGGSAEAHGVNSLGQVAGWRGGRAFRWQAGTSTDLGVPTGFAHSFGFAINASGQVAGSTISASGNTERPFRYTDGMGAVVLGGVGEHNTAFGINSDGDVVGRGRAVAGPLRAFLYTDAAGMVDLNTLIDPASGWVLLGATAINDAGQISGYGFNNLTGYEGAVRLSPSEATSTPPRPTGLSVTRALPANVRLVWRDNAPNETGFRVERQKGTKPFVQIGSTGANATTFVDRTVAAGTSYRYRVFAFNGSGSSTSSEVVTARTPRR